MGTHDPKQSDVYYESSRSNVEIYRVVQYFAYLDGKSWLFDFKAQRGVSQGGLRKALHSRLAKYSATTIFRYAPKLELKHRQCRLGLPLLRKGLLNVPTYQPQRHSVLRRVQNDSTGLT